ncbi:hypothetical protein AALD74_13770 [Lachnospiraceae bacterium 48-21]
MINTNITFLDENDATLHEQILAKLVAQALFFKVRLQKENDNVKQEKRSGIKIK